MIVLNGEDRETDAETIAQLITELDLPSGDRGVAVAVDGEVVPRSGWDAFGLDDGAQVEVVVAVQGG